MSHNMTILYDNNNNNNDNNNNNNDNNICLTYFHVANNAVFFSNYSCALLLHRRSLDAFYFEKSNQNKTLRWIKFMVYIVYLSWITALNVNKYPANRTICKPITCCFINEYIRIKCIQQHPYSIQSQGILPFIATNPSSEPNVTQLPGQTFLLISKPGIILASSYMLGWPSGPGSLPNEVTWSMWRSS